MVAQVVERAQRADRPPARPPARPGRPVRGFRADLLATRLTQAVDWLSATPYDDVVALLDGARVVRAVTSQVLCRAGDHPGHVLVLIDGRLAASRGAPGGPIGHWVDTGSFTTVGLENVVSRRPWSSNVSSVGRSQVLVVPAASLDRLLVDHPSTALAVAGHLGRRLHERSEAMADLVLLDVSRRVAGHLLRHRDGDEVVLQLSQSELAQRLAASRQRVNSALGEFARRGWVTNLGHGRFRLVDAAALAAFAGHG